MFGKQWALPTEKNIGRLLAENKKIYCASGEHRREAILTMHDGYPSNIYLTHVVADVIIANFDKKEDRAKLLEIGNRANKLGSKHRGTDDMTHVLQMHQFYIDEGYLKKARNLGTDVVIPTSHLAHFAKEQCNRNEDAASDAHLLLLARVASRYGKEWKLIVRCMEALRGSKSSTSDVKFTFYSHLLGINKAVRITLLNDALQNKGFKVSQMAKNAARFKVEEKVRQEAMEYYNLKRGAVHISLPQCNTWELLCKVLPLEDNTFLSIWYDHASRSGLRASMPDAFKANLFAMMVQKCKALPGVQQIAQVRLRCKSHTLKSEFCNIRKNTKKQNIKYVRV